MSSKSRAAEPTAGPEPTSPAHTRPGRRAWVAPLLVFVGLLAVQLAWIGSLPAFRGVDEHDHVYRADSVAAGHWVSTGDTTDESRGELVSVRRSIIEAAGPVCDAWPYTKRYDCHAYAPDGPDRALVASGAARYNPAFYWVVGTAARPFEGTAAVYAMRGAAAALCAALVALAFSAMQMMTSSPWRLGALLVVLTPTMTYSTAVAAPNGVEMAAALLAWVSLLALTRVPDAPHPHRWLAALAVTGLVVLSTVRSLGPFWALLIVGAVLALTPVSRIRDLRRRHPRSMLAVAGAWFTASALGAGWSLLSGTNAPSAEGVSLEGSAWGDLPRQVVLWTLQSIAAFPARDSRAPVLVYALFFVASVGILALGLRNASRGTRRMMLAILITVVVVSATITVVTYTSSGLAWQGRYIWPLSMGVPLLAGLSITRTSGRLLGLLIVTGLAAAATAIGQVAVYRRESDNDVLPDDWTFLPAPALVALTVAGFALVFVADLYAGRPRHEHPNHDLVR